MNNDNKKPFLETTTSLYKGFFLSAFIIAVLCLSNWNITYKILFSLPIIYLQTLVFTKTYIYEDKIIIRYPLKFTNKIKEINYKDIKSISTSVANLTYKLGVKNIKEHALTIELLNGKKISIDFENSIVLKNVYEFLFDKIKASNT